MTSRIRDDNDGKTVPGDALKSNNETITQEENYSENKNVQWRKFPAKKKKFVDCAGCLTKMNFYYAYWL